MATNPYLTKLPQFAFNELTFKHRNGAYPLDDTSVWNTKAQFVEYLEEAGTYAYAGQLVTIANGTIDASNGTKDYSLAVVRSDGSCQMIGDHSFESYEAATTWVTANPDAATPGLVISAKASAGNNYLLYVINADKSLSRVSFDSSTDIPEVSWDSITGKPTSTVTDIDAAVTLSKKLGESDSKLTYNSNELAFVSDIPTTYEAAKITGTISIDNLPATVTERLYIAENDTARLALTTADVQNGDTVKVTETGKMYFVKDDTKLGGDTPEQAFEEYAVGAAGSVPWSGVTGKPTTVDGYGITDAVKTTDLSETGVAGKVAIYNSAGKLSATAANADQLGGQNPAYYATAESVTTLSGTVSGLDGDITALEGRMDTAESDITALESSMSTAQADITNLKSGDAITALAASKLTGTVARENLPADVGGKTVTVADNAGLLGLTDAEINLGDLVKQTDTGEVYMYTSAEDIGTADAFTLIVDVADTQIAWAKITGTPTTLSGYGITDAVNTSQVSTAAAANMIVQRDAGGKIAGTVANAETLGGNAVSYFATASDMDAVKAGTAITALDASKLTGTIDIARIPSTVIERLSVVANDAARLALTSDEVQNGDSVKVTETGKMYFVKDATKLGSPDTAEQAFEEYSVGSAASVPWVGITGKPTDLAGYGITEVPFTVITGLDPAVTAAALKTAVDNTHTHANATVLDAFTDDAGKLKYGTNEVAYVADIATLAQIPVLDAAPANPVEGQLYFQKITLD